MRIIWFFLCLLLTQFLFGQTSFEEKIENSRAALQIGKFLEVKQELKPISKSQISSISQRNDALEMLAMVAIAQDSFLLAESLCRDILSQDPYFDTRYNNYILQILFRKIKNERTDVQVFSISKKGENPLKAPAFVEIITLEEIVNRGYNDLEELFHDLPGFDVTRSQGVSYAHIYQRGFRSTLTDKTILLIDGVEQNDLVSNNVNISRQYPLANIDHIEIIYGPSSTIYGANAFIGVVNIVTKSSSVNQRLKNKYVERESGLTSGPMLEFLSDQEDQENTMGLDLNMFYGSNNSFNADASFFGKLNSKSKSGMDIFYSLDARYYYSDEPNFNQYEMYNSLNDFLSISNNYKSYNLYPEQDLTVNQKVDLNGINVHSDNYIIYGDTTKNAGVWNGTIDSLKLSEKGISRARNLDSLAYVNNFGVNKYSEEYYVKGTLSFIDRTKRFVVTAESWKTNNGIEPWYNFRDGKRFWVNKPEYGRWIYNNSLITASFFNQISDNFSLTNLTSYRFHTIDENTNFPSMSGYYNGKLAWKDLEASVLPNPTTTYWFRTSSQLRNEFRLNYEGIKNLSLLAGLEYRNGLIQGDYLKYTDNNVENLGSTSGGATGAEHLRALDYGIFAQGQYNLGNLSLIAGTRIDNNNIRSVYGFGWVQNPRLALVYATKNQKIILKSVYSSAFTNPSFLQRFAETETRISNPRLKPEKIQNIDFGGYYVPSKTLKIGGSIFASSVTGISETVKVGTTTDGSSITQYQPTGEQRFYGAMLSGNFTIKTFSVKGNYSYTIPEYFDQEWHPVRSIAPTRINLILNNSFGSKKRVNANLRINHIGKRMYSYDQNSKIGSFLDPITIVNASVLVKLVDQCRLELNVRNLFDLEYSDPGIRTASGKHPATIPQFRRRFHLKLRLSL